MNTMNSMNTMSAMSGGAIPFDSLKVEELTSSRRNGLLSASAQNGKNGITPLSRSASCIDVAAIKSSARSALSSIGSGAVTAEIGPSMKADDSMRSQTSTLSMGSMSSSLIGNPSMVQFRREQLSLKTSELAPGYAVGVNPVAESATNTVSVSEQRLNADLSSPSDE